MKASSSTVWKKSVRIALVFCLSAFASAINGQNDKNTYIGSQKCGECHSDEYQSYQANSKMAVSFLRMKLMKKFLSENEYQSCLACHTTGYGKAGGFISEEATPELKNVGCEMCHGPGSLHMERNDGKNIVKKVTTEVCENCHSKERVVAFRFKPALFGGAH